MAIVFRAERKVLKTGNSLAVTLPAGLTVGDNVEFYVWYDKERDAIVYSTRLPSGGPIYFKKVKPRKQTEIRGHVYRVISIPKPIAEMAGLKRGDIVDITITADGIIVKPKRGGREGCSQ